MRRKRRGRQRSRCSPRRSLFSAPAQILRFAQGLTRGVSTLDPYGATAVKNIVALLGTRDCPRIARCFFLSAPSLHRHLGAGCHGASNVLLRKTFPLPPPGKAMLAMPAWCFERPRRELGGKEKNPPSRKGIKVFGEGARGGPFAKGPPHTYIHFNILSMIAHIASAVAAVLTSARAAGAPAKSRK